MVTDAQTVTGLEAAGRAAWPGVDVSSAAFEAHVAPHLEAAAGARLDGAGLYIAAACALGDASAVAAVEARYFAALDPALASFANISGLADEVKQRLRKKLFVADAGAPRIAKYGGRGDLGAWLKVAAQREALSLLRKTGREVPGDDAVARLAAAEDDQELAYLKRMYRAEFKAAFAEAFEALTDRQRTLLTYQVVDGLNIDAIGSIYGVHRATAARWIEKIRAQLLSETQRALMRRVQVDRGEADSILRLIQSQLDVSLMRLLGDR